MAENKNKLAFLEESDLDEWKTTYMDLITLLLCFFILLTTMSQMDSQRFKRAAGSIKGSLTRRAHSLAFPGLDEEKGGDSLLEDDQDQGSAVEDMIAEVKTFLNRNDRFKNIVTMSQRNGMIMLKVNNRAFFKKGTADLDKQSYDLLDSMSELLKNFPDFNIHIRGHTDSSPTKSEIYESNWELSSIRATKVLRHFIDKGLSAKRLTATGYADLFPIADNNTEKGRKLNRRVEFVLEAKEN